MRASTIFRIGLFASALCGLAACQSTPAPSSQCPGFRAANLSPAGTVALIQADPAGARRVEGNDRTGRRRECWD